MNECLTTPQHEKQIGYWVSEKGFYNKRIKKRILFIFSDFKKFKECGSSFQCENNYCIDEDLVCDEVDHCGDYSDEATDGRAKCHHNRDGQWRWRLYLFYYYYYLNLLLLLIYCLHIFK